MSVKGLLLHFERTRRKMRVASILAVLALGLVGCGGGGTDGVTSNSTNTSATTGSNTGATAATQTGFVVNSLTGNDATGANNGPSYLTLAAAVAAAPEGATITLQVGDGKPYPGDATLKKGQSLVGAGNQGTSTLQAVESSRPKISGFTRASGSNKIQNIEFIIDPINPAQGILLDGDDGEITGCVFSQASSSTSSNGITVGYFQSGGTWKILGNAFNNCQLTHDLPFPNSGISSGSNKPLNLIVDGNRFANSNSSAAFGLNLETFVQTDKLRGPNPLKLSVTNNTYIGFSGANSKPIRIAASHGARVCVNIEKNSMDGPLVFEESSGDGSVLEIEQLDQIGTLNSFTISAVPSGAVSVPDGTCQIP